MLTADTGATVTKMAAFSYIEPGVVVTVAPARGQDGTRVSVKGTGLRGGGAKIETVTLGGTEAFIEQEGNGVVEVIAAASDAVEAGSVILTADNSDYRGCMVVRRTWCN